MKRTFILSLVMVFALALVAPSVVSAMDNTTPVVKVEEKKTEKKAEEKKACTEEKKAECTDAKKAESKSCCSEKKAEKK